MPNQHKYMDSDYYDLNQEWKEYDLLDSLLNYFTKVNPKPLQLVQKGLNTETQFLNVAVELLRQKQINEEAIAASITELRSYLFGYYILEPLINDEDISDIKVLSYNHIRIKSLNKRLNTEIAFKSKGDYKRFVEAIAIKNKINLGNINAIQTFTDKVSNPKFILRFNITTEIVNSVDYPYLTIRKIPKTKFTMPQLIDLGMLDKKTSAYLIEKAINSKGIYIAGKGGSGKTTLLNTLLEYIPPQNSAAIFQENEELFTLEHPDMMFMHITALRGEGKVNYQLRDLVTNGLLLDLDYLVIGEIKGQEAVDFLTAAYTGHKCWATGHALDARSALNQLAHYTKYASDYSKSEILNMLIGLETIIYLKNFKVDQIVEVIGWDDDTGLLYKQVL